MKFRFWMVDYLSGRCYIEADSLQEARRLALETTHADWDGTDSEVYIAASFIVAADGTFVPIEPHHRTKGLNQIKHYTKGEICSVCKKECRGGFDVYERERPSVGWDFMVVVDSTPDRNFNVCDACNVTICFDCSLDPDSGYCNDCLARYGHPTHG